VLPEHDKVEKGEDLVVSGEEEETHK